MTWVWYCFKVFMNRSDGWSLVRRKRGLEGPELLGKRAWSLIWLSISSTGEVFSWIKVSMMQSFWKIGSFRFKYAFNQEHTKELASTLLSKVYVSTLRPIVVLLQWIDHTENLKQVAEYTNEPGLTQFRRSMFRRSKTLLCGWCKSYSKNLSERSITFMFCPSLKAICAPNILF